MNYHTLEKGLNILSQHWPWILVLCFFVFTFGLMVIEFLVDKSNGPSAQPVMPPNQKNSEHQQTLASLNRLPKDRYRTLSNVRVPRLDGKGLTTMQHVVLSPYGVFVIQAQDQNGYISGDVDAKHWTVDGQDGLQNFINPVLRNQYHVKALAKFLGLPEALSFSIVFFRSEVSFEEEPAYNVISKGLGRHILSHTAQIISPELISRVLAELRTKAVAPNRHAQPPRIDIERFIRHAPNVGLVGR